MRISDWSSDVCSSDLLAIDIVSLVQAEQTDAEGLEALRFIALQRHTGCGLQAGLSKFFGRVNAVVVGVTDHHAGRFKPRGGDTSIAFFAQHCAYFIASFLLFGPNLFKAICFVISEKRRLGKEWV